MEVVHGVAGNVAGVSSHQESATIVGAAGSSGRSAGGETVEKNGDAGVSVDEEVVNVCCMYWEGSRRSELSFFLVHKLQCRSLDHPPSDPEYVDE